MDRVLQSDLPREDRGRGKRHDDVETKKLHVRYQVKRSLYFEVEYECRYEP